MSKTEAMLRLMAQRLRPGDKCLHASGSKDANDRAFERFKAIDAPMPEGATVRFAALSALAAEKGGGVS